MKKIAFVTLLAFAAACSKAKVEEAKKTAQDMKEGNTAPVQYVQGLQNDVRKADATADKANAVIQQQQQQVDEALKQAQ